MENSSRWILNNQNILRKYYLTSVKKDGHEVMTSNQWGAIETIYEHKTIYNIEHIFYEMSQMNSYHLV